MPLEYPCSSCHKNVNKNHRAICCDICDKWIHIKCNYLNLSDYNKLKNDCNPFFCINCMNKNIPFTNLTNNEFILLLTKGVNIPADDTSSIFTPYSPEMQTHINELNKFLNKSILSPDEDDDEGEDLSPINCNYYNHEEFSKAKFNSSKSFSIFHFNIHSIQLHIESLRTLLLSLESDNFEFDIIAISESKLKKNCAPIVDITINNYHDPISTPSEANKGGILLYVNKKLNFKPRPDLKIYEPKVLESAFIEIINPKKANDIIGTIYRHPSIDTDSFNNNHVRPLITKLSLEKNKNICIAGDFNINLLNVSSHDASSEFFDILSSNFLLPTISLPTKLNSSGNHTLIDNIYSNIFNPDIISGNILFNVSDGHLPSFVIIPKPNQNHLPKKHNFYKRNTKQFNPKDEDFPISKFLMSQDFLSLDWKNILEIEKLDANLAFNNFYSAIVPIIDNFMPLEKVKNKDHKRRYKPWITNGILTSMKRRDKLLQQYIKIKEITSKSLVHTEYKLIRNKIVELIQQSKQNYYSSYFASNNRNLRKIWQGIKGIINVKAKSSSIPTCISENDKIFTDPTEISNCFNDYFSNVADNILKERNYNGDGNFSKFLPPSSPHSLSVDPVDGDEICSIINLFNLKKASGPSSIPSQILFHMQDELAKPLSWIANICFLTGTHPTSLKTAKVIPILKKALNYSHATIDLSLCFQILIK